MSTRRLLRAGGHARRNINLEAVKRATPARAKALLRGTAHTGIIAEPARLGTYLSLNLPQFSFHTPFREPYPHVRHNLK